MRSWKPLRPATEARTPPCGETRPKDAAGPREARRAQQKAPPAPPRPRPALGAGRRLVSAGQPFGLTRDRRDLPTGTPCGARALPEPQLKKPLSGWTEAEQQLRPSQQKSPKMPGAVLGQPPARGTLGLVVYVRDSVFARFVSQPFNVAFILPLRSQDSDFLVAARPHVLQYPEVSSSRPGARFLWTTVPRSTVKCCPLSFPGPQFPEPSVSRRFSSHSLLELAGLRPATGRTATT